MEELIQKVQENLDSSELLIGSGLNRQAAALLRCAVRNSVFCHLQEKGESFTSTREAFSKIIIKYQDSPLSDDIIFVETTGLLCEWDEYFGISDLQINELQDKCLDIITNLMPAVQINNSKRAYIRLAIEMERHLQDTEITKATQYAAATRNEKWHKWFLRFGFILTIVGVSAFLYTIFKTNNNLILSFIDLKIKMVTISQLFALLGAGMTLWPLIRDYSGKAVTHRRFAEEYNGVSKKCKNWQTDFPDERNIHNAKTYVISIRERIISINNLSPATLDSDYRKGNYNRESGSYDYSTSNNKKQKSWIRKTWEKIRKFGKK